MDKEIIQQVLLSLESSLENKGDGMFLDDKESVKVDIDNFQSVKGSESDRKICFVDGGNLEILKAPNFSVQIIRVYYTIYQRNKRILAKKKEFFILVKAVNKEGKIFYETESFGDSIVGKLRFFAYDEEMKTGMARVEVSSIAPFVRRLCEIRIIEEIVDELGKGDIIVLDGDLQAKTRVEKEFLERAYELSNAKGIIVSGLAKTNTLLSDSGNAFMQLLLDKAPLEEWYYKILNEDGKDIMILRLHRKSNHIFKFEIRKENLDDIDEVAYLLKRNSVDPVFLGYPYGLIEADRFARVTRQELDYLKTKFILQAGKWYKELAKYLNNTNSHEILDTIS
ncbi:MAG: DNA double-strand break repair nuclease NurA [Candidatus Woesearchaeota archaeon]